MKWPPTSQSHGSVSEREQPTHFVKLIAKTYPQKVAPHVDYLCNIPKATHSKQSPFGRKLAQSGHPAPPPLLTQSCFGFASDFVAFCRRCARRGFKLCT
jgi:hypothetical protein